MGQGAQFSNVGRSTVLFGHCVGMRDLGRIVFFSLRTHATSLQVVCTEKPVIDAARAVESYALVEIRGYIQEKQRRGGESTLQYEIHATGIRDLSRGHHAGAVSRRLEADKVPLFVQVEPTATLAHELSRIRNLIGEHGFVEIYSPPSTGMSDWLGIAALLHRAPCATTDPIVSKPPFHRYTRLLAAGGLHRFWFVANYANRLVLHAVLCCPQGNEGPVFLQKILHTVWGAPDEVETPAPTGNVRVDRSTERSQLVARGYGVLDQCHYFEQGTWIATSCMFRENEQMQVGVLTKLTDSASGRRLWLPRLRAFVHDPIPDMFMATIVLPERLCAIHGAASDMGRGPESCLQTGAAELKKIQESFTSLQLFRMAEEERLRTSLEIVQASCRRSLDLERLLPLDTALTELKQTLPAFQLSYPRAKALVELCRRIQPGWSRDNLVNLFQLLWTLLGSEAVRGVLDPAYGDAAGLHALIDRRVITEKRQLLYVHPQATHAIRRLRQKHDDISFSTMCGVLRRFMGRMPNYFSTVVSSMAEDTIYTELALKDTETLFAIAEGGIVTVRLARLLLESNASSGLERMQLALMHLGEKVFQNGGVTLEELGAMFVRSWYGSGSEVAQVLRAEDLAKVGQECIYYLFRPVTMDFATFALAMERIPDCSAHWTQDGLSLDGEHWEPALGCYQYFFDRGDGKVRNLRLYPSKNAFSFFAKSTAGICTDANVALFVRSDHFHLNIVDGDDGRCAGNVQLYSGLDGEKRYLLVRGINPTQGFCWGIGTDYVVEIILNAIFDLASFSGIHEVRLSAQNGLWNSNSSRAEVRASLNRMFIDKPLMEFIAPLHLYDYYGSPKYISHYYKIRSFDAGNLDDGEANPW